MQCPARKTVRAHARVPETIEEKLAVPKSAPERREQPVRRKRTFAAGEFTQRPVPPSEVEAVNKRREKRARVREEVNDVSLEVPRAMGSRDICHGLSSGERK